VPRPQIIRNDDIEAFAKRLCLGKTEDPFRAVVPEANYALGIGKDDRVRRLANECPAEAVDIDREANYSTFYSPTETAPNR
jgi:hypothetical protein